MDGPSGTGKSTVSRRFARAGGAAYLDTGAMYRAVTLAVLRAGLDASAPEDEVVAVAAAARLRSGTDPAEPHIELDGEDVEAEIRGGPVTQLVSAVSAHPAVRRLLVQRQRELVAEALDGTGGAVVEGRDIGSVVLPDAPLKVYLTAPAEVRAARRAAQDRKAGRVADVDAVLADVRRRDQLDSTRATSPLHAAADAVVLDTDGLSVDAVLDPADGACPGARAADMTALLTSGLDRSAPDLPPGASPRLHDLARWVGSWCFRPALRVRVHHGERIPPTGPVVLVANHSAFVDGPLLLGLVGRRAVFLTKQEMFRGPLAWLLPRIGQLAVRRGEPDPAPLRAAVGVLRGGGMVGVFPEGTRGAGDVAAVQHGAAWLARAAGAVVLPVVVRGTRRGPRRRFRPRVDVLVGTPLTVAPGGGRAGLVAATETVRAALAGLVVELDEVRSNGE